jgi:GTP-binding protein Era
VGERLAEVAALGTELSIEWAEIVPVSARTGYNVSLLADLFAARMPPGPALYPEGDLTDEPEEILVAEIIREAALEGLTDELPHSLAVVVDEMGLREGRSDDAPLMDVHARLFVERPSQKSIIIGKGGEGLRRIGTAARRRIEALLGTPVYLDLHVTVAKNWQRDPKQLRRLGF